MRHFGVRVIHFPNRHFPASRSLVRRESICCSRPAYRLLPFCLSGRVWRAGRMVTVRAEACAPRERSSPQPCHRPSASWLYHLHLFSDADPRHLGVGLTLNVPMARDGHVWYPELERSRRWVAEFGPQGTGNIYDLATVDATVHLHEEGQEGY